MSENNQISEVVHIASSVAPEEEEEELEAIPQQPYITSQEELNKVVSLSSKVINGSEEWVLKMPVELSPEYNNGVDKWQEEERDEFELKYRPVKKNLESIRRKDESNCSTNRASIKKVTPTANLLTAGEHEMDVDKRYYDNDNLHDKDEFDAWVLRQKRRPPINKLH